MGLESRKLRKSIFVTENLWLTLLRLRSLLLGKILGCQKSTTHNTRSGEKEKRKKKKKRSGIGHSLHFIGFFPLNFYLFL